eukprot:SAG31_NODE_7472_length_1681_cov_1.244627_2_plen_388_part_00
MLLETSHDQHDFVADNDGILLAPIKDPDIIANNRTGESVLNSAMAAGILADLADVLAAMPGRASELAANITHLRNLSAQQTSAVSAVWGGRWFPRMWAPDSGFFGTEQNQSIWWSNAFPLLYKIPPVHKAGMEQDQLVQAIEGGLLGSTGVSFSNKSEHADYQDPWFAGGMYMLEAFGIRGYSALAWKVWRQGLLATHAEMYPAHFVGIYSGSDHYSDASMVSGGHRVQLNGSIAAITTDAVAEGSVAVFNSWSHTTPLWGIPAVLGIEFSVSGATIRPSALGIGALASAVSTTDSNQSAPLGDWNFSSPLLGVVKSSALGLRYTGWYKPIVEVGQCELRVELSLEDRHAIRWMRLNNGRTQPVEFDTGGVAVVLSAEPCAIEFELF